MNSNFKIIKFLLITFIAWRLALLFITFLGVSILPTNTPPSKDLFWPTPNIDYWTRWGDWDGGHFLSIAKFGYTKMQTSFFPFYPAIIKFLLLFGITPFWSGFLISQVSTLITLFFLYKLVVLDFSEKIAKRAVVALLIFPTSFYLVALYSESLFLALTLAAFYYIRKKEWLIASLLAGFSAVTRFVGIAVIAALFIEYFLYNPNSLKISDFYNSFIKRVFLISLGILVLLTIILAITQKIKLWFVAGLLMSFNELFFLLILIFFIFLIVYSLLKNMDFERIFKFDFYILLLSFIPFLLYLDFQKLQFQNPLVFINQWSYWNTKPSLPWIAAINAFDFLRFHHFFRIGITGYVIVEFLVLILLLIGLFLSITKLRVSYTIYFIITFLLPLSTGVTLGLVRYTLVIFPLFILLAFIENEYIQKVGAFVSVLILSLYSILYINSFWVS